MSGRKTEPEMPKTLSRFAFVVAALLAFAPMLATESQANSRFKLVNENGSSASIAIYNGKDANCTLQIFAKTVEPGETLSMGCYGQGKHRCKIHVTVGVRHKKACTLPDKYDTCGGKAILMENHATIKITATDHRNCVIINPMDS